MQDIMKLCDNVRESGCAAHRYLPNGHVEKVCEYSLANRLRKLGLKMTQELPLSVFDEDGTLLGQYYTDLFVEDRLIVELKAVRSVWMSTSRNCWATPRASRLAHGLLGNFGAPRFQSKKYIVNDQIESLGRVVFPE